MSKWGHIYDKAYIKTHDKAREKIWEKIGDSIVYDIRNRIISSALVIAGRRGRADMVSSKVRVYMMES